MQTDILKIVLTVGIRASNKMTNCMIELLPEETGRMVKSARTSWLKMVHEITGDMLEKEQHNEGATKQKQTGIDIE